MLFTYSRILICFLFFSFSITPNVLGKVAVGSWNLENFGRKKTDQAIDIIADAVKDLDVVAIQEVLVSEGGAEAVARLADALSRKGYQWDYVISNITTSGNVQERERYAFLWKPSKVKLAGRPFLATCFEQEMCREPFMATFEEGGKCFTLVSFHALPKKKQPEAELKYLKSFADSFVLDNLIFLGDFNCPQSNTVFDPLKRSYYCAALTGQKTTLKQECLHGECLASEYDNILYPQKQFHQLDSGIIPFYLKFEQDMAAARKISDHLPVFVVLE